MREIADMSNDVALALRTARCDVVVVRETDRPGPSDLLVEWTGLNYHGTFHCWIELKVGAPLRAEQEHFLENRWKRYRNAFLMHYDAKQELYILYPGHQPLASAYRLWFNKSLGDIRSMLKTIEEIMS